MHLAEDRRCPAVARGPPVVKQVETLHGIKASYAFIRIQRIHSELVTKNMESWNLHADRQNR